MTHVRADQWQNKSGDLVSYLFWYYEKRTVRVEAKYCPAAIVEKYRCVRGPTMPHDENTYSISLKIKNVEPIEKDFKVFVEIENTGQKQVLLGVNGELPDGSPELWVLGVQQLEDGEWGAVDAVCPEHPPFDWVTLRPGAKLESWALAAEFPEPNHRFAVCYRRIAHLRGKIRAAIRYYTDAFEIEEVVENKNPYFAVSEPVDLPSSR